MLVERLVLLAGGPLPLHLALDPRVQIVEEVVIGLLRWRLALYRPRDLGLVVALDRPRAALLGDLLLEFFYDEVRGVVRLARKLLVQRGHALLLNPERFRRGLVQIFIRSFVRGAQSSAPLRGGSLTSISAI